VELGKKKVYGGNDLPKSHVLSSEWKTERVREDATASGDREDGEEDDDELSCVIGESEDIPGVGLSGAKSVVLLQFLQQNSPTQCCR